MIYTLTLNPGIDKTVYVENFEDYKQNIIKKALISAGGKGINVSKALKVLSYDSVALGFIGGEYGRYVINNLDEFNIKHNFIKIKNNIRENVKVIDQQGKLTELNEKGPFVDKKDVDDLLTTINSTIHSEDILVISGSAPQGVSKDIYKSIIEIVNHNGGKAILDADKDLFTYGVQAKPYLIKPNLKELCNYYNIEETNDIELLKDKCKQLLNLGIKEIMLSMGENGSLYINENEVYYAEPIKTAIESTVGAGDAMVAGLTIAIQKDLATKEKINLATACATAACLTSGTEPGDIADVNRLIKEVVIQSII